MTLETAKELKALEIGYTNWGWLVTTYSRYDQKQFIDGYLRECEFWVKEGRVPESSMRAIERNVFLFGERYAEQIKQSLEAASESTTTSEIIKETIDYIHAL